MIGAHIDSTIDTVINEAKRIYDLGGKIIQLFANTTSKKAKQVYKDLNIFLLKHDMKCVVHASYTINCAKDWNYHSWWIKQFMLEIENAYLIGADYIVLHMGKILDLDEKIAINNMYTSLLYVHKQTIYYKNVKILLETSTGQGSEMCYELEKLAHFYKKIKQHVDVEVTNRFGICIDTCHIFEAGYDIRDEIKIKKYLKMFDELIGEENIKLIHLNDSKKDIGLKVDRHANLGKGFIGGEPLVYLTKYFNKINIPVILETPTDGQEDDIKMLIYVTNK